MSDTRIADILDALYDLYIADAYLAAEVAANRLSIHDGPTTIELSKESILVIGGSVAVDEDAIGEVQWDWATLGVSGQFANIEEWVRIPCGISTTHGDADDMRALRRRAISIFAAAAAAVRGTNLGISCVMWCIPAVSQFVQRQTPTGPEVVFNFTVAVRTHI